MVIAREPAHNPGATAQLPRRARRLSLMAVLLILLPAGALYAQVDLTSLLAATDGTLQWSPSMDYGVILAGGNQFVFSPGMSWGLFDYSRRIATGEIRRSAGGEILFSAAGAQAIEADLSLPAPVVAAQPPPAAGSGPEAAGAGSADATPGASTAPGGSAAEAAGRSSSAPAARSGRQRIAAIIIDPGHGGKDPGTMSDPFGPNGNAPPLEEKNIVLAIGLHVYHELQRLYPDKKIVITRDRDVYVSLERRAQIANDISLGPGEAKIFVSIHANASLDKAAHGYEVWYLPPSYQRTVITPAAVGTDSRALLPILNTMAEQEYETESILLAKDVVSGLRGAIGSAEPDRGLKSNDWFVVRNVRMPAVLIEVGFVTNPEEARLLAQPSYLDKLAQGITAGISRFVNFYDSQDGFTK